MKPAEDPFTYSALVQRSVVHEIAVTARQPIQFDELRGLEHMQTRSRDVRDRVRS